MINSMSKITTLLYNLFIFCIILNNATNLNEPSKKNGIVLYESSVLDESNKTGRSDDEDGTKTMQSSGDGPNGDPDVYPNLSPFNPSKSTASMLVDVAVERAYKFYMLPGSVMTPQLRSFHNEIIENFKLELQIEDVELEYQILSLRPGPLIPKPKSKKSGKKYASSVFVRMNITQNNSQIINPYIIFEISKCGREGVLGNLSISEQIIYPQIVCSNSQVYCLPDCRNGSYCDGIQDCPNTKLDETASCPQCLYKQVTILSSSHLINEDEDLIFDCNFNSKCQNISKKIRWNFPPPLKRFEQKYQGEVQVRSLPRHLVNSGSYGCSIDGEMSSANISVIKKPTVYVTKADPEADTVIISEIEGVNVDYWCNSTDGIALWVPVGHNNVKISNYNERCSKLSFVEITKGLAGSYHCNILWGTQRSRIIKRTVQVVIVCDKKDHFECKEQSSVRSCIPIKQKCDSVMQCSDGSDEANCNVCPGKDLTIDVGQTISREVGDTAIIECSTSNTLCKPLRWWNKGKIIVTNENIVLFKNFIFIVNMRTEDSGTYQCSSSANKSVVGVFVHVNTSPTLRLSPSNDDVNITQGQTKSVNCIVDYPENVTYSKVRPSWTKHNDNSLPTGVNTVTNSYTETQLIFNKAHVHMSGAYRCQVTWGTSNGKVVTLSTTINVNPLVCQRGEKMCVDQSSCFHESLWCDGNTQCQDGSDERLCDRCRNGFVFVQPPSLTVLVGQTVELHCFYHKDCAPVKWRTVTNSSSGFRREGFSGNNSKLILPNVGPDDSNIYECFSGGKYSRSNVTVIREVSLKVPDYVFMDYGQNINVDCQSNFGQPQWRRRDLKQLSEISGASQSYPSPNTAKLSISSPSYDARGYYVCFVRLSNVEEVNSFMFVHIKDLECSQDQLRCDEKTKCVPKTKLCDQINDCESGEDERNCSKCKNDLEIKPKELTISKLGYGVFDCIVSSKDCLPIEWKFKTQNSVMKSPPFYKFEKSLYIMSPQFSDAGEISCSSGRRISTGTLIVKDLKLSLKPNNGNNSTILRGENGRITCRSSLGTPKWISPEESAVSMYGIRYVNAQPNTAVIEMENVRPGASGKYVCYVSYSREKKQLSISINVL